METSPTNGTAHAPPTAPPAPQMVLVKLIHKSKTNRKRFDEARLKELADSIKAVGVRQAVELRPHPTIAGEFELVFGERRVRATKLAGFDSIPATVSELTDLQVCELQAIENAQREDVHPLEEADVFRRWHEEHGVAVPTIAARVGKKSGYVYGRLKLCALGEEAREAFLADEIDPTVALQLARIANPKMQAQAVKELAQRAKQWGPLSFLQSQQLLRDRFMLSLDQAPFNIADASLVVKAGACSDCPKRSGNQRDLFPDKAERNDLCTDPDCFAEKKEAAWKQRAEEAKAKGHEVLSDKKSKEVFHEHGGGALKREAGYVKADEICPDDPKNRTYRKLLGAEAPLTVARHNGKAVDLVETDGLKAKLREAGHNFAKEKREKKKTEKREAAKAAPKKKEELHRNPRVVAAAMSQIVGKIEANTNDGLRVLVSETLRIFSVMPDAAWVKRRGLELKGEKIKAVEKLADSMTDEQLIGLLFELTVEEQLDWRGTHEVMVVDAAKRLKVDLKKIEAKIGAEIKAEAAAQKVGEKLAEKDAKAKAPAKKGARR